MSQEIINNFLKKGFLLSPDVFTSLKNIELDELNEKIEKIEKCPIVLNSDILLLINADETLTNVNWKEFEKSRMLLEKGRDESMYGVFLDLMNYNISEEKKVMLNKILDDIKKPEKTVIIEKTKEKNDSSVIILKMYEEENTKKTVDTFVQHYRARYNTLRKLLSNRQEMQNVVSISRIFNKKVGEELSLIGLISDKQITKNKNILLTIEDLSGKFNVLINKGKEIYDLAKDLVLDEVIGIKGIMGDKIVFANNLFLPEIPQNEDIKKCEEEVYVAFTSDLHVGSKHFLEKDFLKFISWLNGEIGSSNQKEVSQKVKYLFVLGDLVEGVGIYPGQEEDLEIKDIYEQYVKVAEYLSLIRKDINIIICPGNHDALRIAEPQPLLNKKYTQLLWDLPNVIMVTNPCLINIHSSKDFEGFNVLIYHGFSFDYYGDNVESIRLSKPNISERAELIIKYLLQKRHLAPTHASTLFMPSEKEDPLVIDKIPDFFVCAHIHKASIGQYQNVTNICCSCWQSIKEFQIRVGHKPDPSRVPIVNLKTRETKLMKFCD